MNALKAPVVSCRNSNRTSEICYTNQRLWIFLCTRFNELILAHKNTCYYIPTPVKHFYMRNPNANSHCLRIFGVLSRNNAELKGQLCRTRSWHQAALIRETKPGVWSKMLNRLALVGVGLNGLGKKNSDLNWPRKLRT